MAVQKTEILAGNGLGQKHILSERIGTEGYDLNRSTRYAPRVCTEYNFVSVNTMAYVTLSP